jgi:hypothetical protein
MMLGRKRLLGDGVFGMAAVGFSIGGLVGAGSRNLPALIGRGTDVRLVRRRFFLGRWTAIDAALAAVVRDVA